MCKSFLKPYSTDCTPRKQTLRLETFWQYTPGQQFSLDRVSAIFWSRISFYYTVVSRISNFMLFLEVPLSSLLPAECVCVLLLISLALCLEMCNKRVQSLHNCKEMLKSWHVELLSPSPGSDSHYTANLLMK